MAFIRLARHLELINDEASMSASCINGVARQLVEEIFKMDPRRNKISHWTRGV